MSSIYDVRCDRCGESGSIKRMDIKAGLCFYCREEEKGDLPVTCLDRAAIAEAEKGETA